jgi:ATP-dependent Lhr-like helicase
MRGLVDFARIRELCARVGDRIVHVALERISPLSAPLFLEPGRVPVNGSAEERLLEEEVTRLLRESGLAQMQMQPE